MIFTLDTDNNITAHATPEEAAAASTTPFDSFASENELAELIAGWAPERLLALWNSLPGVAPVKRFKNGNAAASRIWERIQKLGEAADAGSAAREAEGGPEGQSWRTGRQGRAREGARRVRRPPPRRTRPRPGRPRRSRKPAGPREGSKTAQVVAMLQRKNGATLVEIMDKMGWQRHTVRGFMAGAMKKAGYTVESFKPEGGERTYKLCGAPHNAEHFWLECRAFLARMQSIFGSAARRDTLPTEPRDLVAATVS